MACFRPDWPTLNPALACFEMPETKGSILRFSIAFAISNVKLHLGKRFVPLKLTEQQRYAIADDTIRELRKHGGWKDLDEPVPDNHPGPSWIDGKPP